MPGTSLHRLFKRSSLARTKTRARTKLRSRRPMLIELLEDRTVPAPVTLQGFPTWIAEGPAPNAGGQDENIPAEIGGGANAVTGAIEAIAVNPGNNNQVFIGAVNGGLWRTNNISANPVSWTPLTDQLPALEISALQFDPTDAGNNTVVSGIGNTSNIVTTLGPLTGLLKTTDGGNTWTQLGNTSVNGLQNENVSAVLPRGASILVGVASGPMPGLYRSTNGGGSFQLISGLNNLNNGAVFDVVGDPSNNNRAYVVVGGGSGGLFRTDDLGNSWVPVNSNAAITALLTSGNLSNARMAVSPVAPQPVYVAIAVNGQLGNGSAPGLFRSTNQGGAWIAMDLPQTLDASRAITAASNTTPIVITTSANHGYANGDRVRITGSADAGANGDWAITVSSATPNQFTLVGSVADGGGGAGGTAQNIQGILHGRQALPNLSVAADPTNVNLVYIAGDRQDFLGGDSSIGANAFAARIFRGDASVAAQGAGAVVTDATHQWTPLTNNGTAGGSSPHADSRALVFENGRLLYSGDGGIFEENNPTTAGGDWFSKNGVGVTGLQLTQFSSAISYDSNSNIIFGGAQDTGTPQQSSGGSPIYNDQTRGDGPFTAIDDLTTPGGNSHRYIGFGRVDYDNANNNLGTGINLIPAGGVSGFTGFAALAVSHISPAAGNSTRIVIFNGGNPGPGGNALFQSDNAGTAATTGAIVYTQINTGAGWNGVNQSPFAFNGGVYAIAVGGVLGGVANQDVIYAGSGTQVFLRSTNGGTLTATAAQPAGAGFIQSIAIDPNNWTTAYVTDGSRVYQTTDAGATWTNITGNLNDNLIFSIVAVDGTGSNAGLSAVLIGETNGVFRMLTSAPGLWTKFGPNFPNSSVWGVTYSQADDVLVAGTSGRGAFELQSVQSSVFTGGTVLICGDEDATNENDTFKLIRDPLNPLLLDIFVNNTTPIPTAVVPLAAIQKIAIYGGGGNNTLIVDSSNGLVSVPQGIDWNAADSCPMMPFFGTPSGQDGFNQTILTQTAGANAPNLTSDTYSVGPNAGDGTSVVVDSAGNTQTVNFFEVSPTFDNLPAPLLSVNGTNAANAINYKVGFNNFANLQQGIPNPAWGEVSIDNQEPIEFQNKLSLTINGLAGSDEINLNNPNAPTSLTNITVNGDDPTASNTLIANGTIGLDNISFRPTAADGGNISSAGPVGINFATIQHVTINGQGSNDRLTIISPPGTNNRVVYTGSSSVDAAAVQVGSLVPLSFANLGSGGAVNLVNGSGIQSDTLVYQGGPGGNDLFTVDAATVTLSVNQQFTVNGPGIGNLKLVGPINSEDVLVLNAPVANQFVVLNRGRTADTGSLRLFTAAVLTRDISYANVPIVSPNVATPNGLFNPNLLVMGPDLNEPNEFGGTSTFLGSGSTIQIQHGAIFPNGLAFPGVAADQDFYRVVAQNTGTMDFQVYFRLFAPSLLPAGGSLDLQAFSGDGSKLADSANVGIDSSGVGVGPRVFGALGGGGNARVRIPVVAGQSYFFRVVGFDAGGNATTARTVVNGYDATIINTLTPVPATLQLSRSVLAVTVTSGGAGYVTAPLVIFTGGGANATAVATAVLGTGAQAGQVVEVDISSASGFTATPVVNFVGGGGVGAAAVATISDFGDLPANAPNDDTGRSQFDNVTNTNKPTIFLRLDDAGFLNDLPGNQTSNAPPAGVIPIPFDTDTTVATANAGFRIAVYDGGNGAPAAANPHALDPNDSTFIGFATPVTGVPHLYSLTIGSQGADALADGLHHITARVQMVDPARETGFGDRSASVDIIVDTVRPPIDTGTGLGLGFGTAQNGHNGLAASSDSGVIPEEETFHDLITNVSSPSLYGTSEANSIVRLYVDTVGDGVFRPGQDIYLGLTVAVPIDGTNQFSNGMWRFKVPVDLNNATLFPNLPHDGSRIFFATAEDLAGNVSQNAAGPFRIFLDTQGPQITNVQILNPITGALATGSDGVTPFNLFGLKPTNTGQGPTPLVDELVISVQDNPAFDPNFPARIAAIKKAVAQTPGEFILTGDFVGHIAIRKITVTLFDGIGGDPAPVPGQPLKATITLDFDERNPLTGFITVRHPLPDDRYTLTVLDSGVIDLAGNRLDGESNAREPNGAPNFPSGDGIPGGNFVGRFTVNSRAHIGVNGSAGQFLDINGNGLFDPAQNNNDVVNKDLTFRIGLTSDWSFTGDFRPPVGFSFSPGFAKLGSYGVDGTGVYRFLLDFNSNGVPTRIISGLQINAHPLAFDFNKAIAGDELALADGRGNWWIDFNHENNITVNSFHIFDGLTGFPIAGDFDGNGEFDLGSYRPDLNTFFFDLNPTDGVSHRLAQINLTAVAGNPPIGGVSAIPIAADVNTDGVTDLGLFVPRQQGATPTDTSSFYWLISNDLPIQNPLTGAFFTQRIPGTVNTLGHVFSPSPFTGDLFFQFGGPTVAVTPLAGLWDPPVGGNDSTAAPLQRAYQFFLGRPLSAPESINWTATLQQTGMTYPQFLASLLVSPEYQANHGGTLAGTIQGMYRDILGRSPGAVELNSVMARIGTGTSVATVAFGILASPEAQNDALTGNDWQSRFHQQNEAWIAHLYHDILGRTASAADISAWEHQIDPGNMSRTAIVGALENSTEHRTRVIRSYYQKYLGRDPQAAGISTWLNFLSRGGNVDQMLVGILSSPEYLTRHGNTMSGFVDALFTDLLGRQGKAAGISAWASSGLSRPTLAYSFLHSHEQVARLVNTDCQTYLHHSADVAATQFWQSKMDLGGKMQDIVDAIFLSKEYLSLPW